MSRKKLQLTGKPNNEVEDAFIPLFLRISVWTSRALCVSPACLRRARGRWRLAVSRPLFKLQRLIVFIVNVLGISAYACDFLSEKRYRVRVGTTTLTAAVRCVEACLILLSYSFGVWVGSQKLKHTISILQQINKIKHGIKKRNNILKYSKVKHVLLISYISWNIISYFVLFSAIMIYLNLETNLLVASLYAVSSYRVTAVTFLQLEWSMTLVEICATLKLVNDELEYLLKTTATTLQLGNFNTDIHRLNQSYDEICEMLRQMDINGPFILFYFLLISLLSLITPYNLIAVLFTGQIQKYWDIAMQVNWIMVHFSHLVTMVEPCHWLQKQKERTRHLLAGLACEAGRRRQDLAPLATFLHQTQSDFPLGPYGIFTFSRPLVASFFGGIGTYLIIIVQCQTVFEII